MSMQAAGPTPSEVFAICATDEIDAGAARAFDLARLDDQGEAKPFRILVAKNGRGEFFAYVNSCPHQGVWLNIGAGTFLDETGKLLKCGRHGAKFEIESGKCVSGDCEGGQLEIVPLLVIDGDVCLHGVNLVEDDRPRYFDDDDDDTMEITIHPG
jgi:nitrite reductase/ring-hydroxylating ferredoxin subunit